MTPIEKYSCEKVEENKSYLWHNEGENRTLIAITNTLEKAHFLMKAANQFNATEALAKDDKGKEDWSKLSKIAPPEKWLEVYKHYQEILLQQDTAAWWQEQFLMCDKERSALKEDTGKAYKEEVDKEKET